MWLWVGLVCIIDDLIVWLWAGMNACVCVYVLVHGGCVGRYMVGYMVGYMEGYMEGYLGRG